MDEKERSIMTDGATLSCAASVVSAIKGARGRSATSGHKVANKATKKPPARHACKRVPSADRMPLSRAVAELWAISPTDKKQQPRSMQHLPVAK